ncbi:hypothetical protein LTR62_006379 [Meristemomyces frigidus]|uniref:Uncharacterized protein n=1 Tax=Meristemomyces frigidus TaxID=1508187 RepID=A0AAN7TCZ4_9PEZI|nr:hypothetical protein LTR62_006379 [Meristemomyces frigidus]
MADQQQHPVPTAPMYSKQWNPVSSVSVPWHAAQPLSSNPPQLFAQLRRDGEANNRPRIFDRRMAANARHQFRPPSQRVTPEVNSTTAAYDTEMDALLPGLLSAAQTTMAPARERQADFSLGSCDHQDYAQHSISPKISIGFARAESPQYPDSTANVSRRRISRRRHESSPEDNTGVSLPHSPQYPLQQARASRLGLSKRDTPFADGGIDIPRSRSPRCPTRVDSTILPNATSARRGRRAKAKVEAAQKADSLAQKAENGPELNSSACVTPDFRFVDTKDHHTDIHIFKVETPLLTCMTLKESLIHSFTNSDVLNPGLLRMETQDLHILDNRRPAHLVLLRDAAHFNGNAELPATIVAVLSESDSTIRWYYTVLPATTLLYQLDARKCVHPVPVVLKAHSRMHNRFFTFLRESFLKAIQYPHHPDYLAAQKLTDYAPAILDSETGLARLEENKDLYYSIATSDATLTTDPSQDRYLLALSPPERLIASETNLACSAYLLLKRRFFHAFWRELVAELGKVESGKGKVRTEARHQEWLVQEVGMKARVAKRLVISWRVLGLLDEARYLPWLKEGWGND